ncbi:hypothetical protein BC941DRAFT_426733 [Chlamydoabsidia padenii]|nr:hypothetical protein BC941DRAFT_426733 [Chlamydoabsidia padenii]
MEKKKWHSKLIALMTEFEEKKGRRNYQHATQRHQCEDFEYQANVPFMSRKSTIQRELLATMNGKHWHLGNIVPDIHYIGTQ